MVLAHMLSSKITCIIKYDASCEFNLLSFVLRVFLTSVT